jgi:N-carbamoylputrescine amidase
MFYHLKGKVMQESDHSLTLGLIQFAASADESANIHRALMMGEQAAQQGAQFVVFHEMFMLPWHFARPDDASSLAHSADSEIWAPFRALARQYASVLICSFYERNGADEYYNAALVIDADGETAGHYRKHHLPPDNERLHFMRGDEPFRAFSTRYGKIGVYVCWDNFFPEGARALALDGAQIVFAPTAASERAAVHRWETALCANALTNGCYWVRANRIEPPFYGASLIAGPDGKVIAGPLGTSDMIALTTLDMDRIESERHAWTFLADRRPDQYGALVQD